MRHLKTFGLAAVAAMALMAFAAGTASATQLCKTSETTCSAGWRYPTGSVIKESLLSGTKTTFPDTFNIFHDECTGSEIEGETTNESGTTISVNVTKLSLTGCTMTTDVLEQTGTFSINEAGTVSGTGFQVTIIIGSETCIYGLGPTSTTVGPFIGGNPAHITYSNTVNKLPGSGPGCLASIRWRATYVITSPAGTIHVTM